MRIDIITILPELMKSPFEASIIKRAQEKNQVEIHFHTPRDFTNNVHKTIDDKPYGGMAGMVMMPEPLSLLIESLLEKRSYDKIIYLTPDGEPLKQKRANSLSLCQNLMLICGHYKGIDQRIRDLYVNLEISIGDYVLTGGELAACVLVDTIVRLIPGVIGNETSALTDSFQDGLLAPPIYTRPEVFKGLEVPKVLLSGNFEKIEAWNFQMSQQRTQERRPDLLDEFD
ncbi:MAG: tRNA (guanosine(37)-N1)-methyltransferase TrmD [Flavobacteriaceae bacterium]|nr:MAG: tRNA (guanosine(37)-N1)-methyltransferase TrmD [Flavobacteriaceae bacterium]